MQKAFRRAENHLLDALKHRKGEVEAHYGDLTLVDGFFTGNRARRWKDRAPLFPSLLTVIIALHFARPH